MSSSGSCVDQQVSVEEIIDYTKYSSFNKLLRVTGIVLKFKLVLQKCQQGEGLRSLVYKNHLIGEDMDVAELLWLHSIQTKSFSSELLYLQFKSKTPVWFIH